MKIFVLSILIIAFCNLFASFYMIYYGIKKVIKQQ